MASVVLIAAATVTCVAKYPRLHSVAAAALLLPENQAKGVLGIPHW